VLSDEETYMPQTANPAARVPKFTGESAFQTELRRRVDAYFERTGHRQRDCWQMYLKTAVLLVSCVGAYAALVFAAPAWWLAIPLAAVLALAMAGIAFNVQHDAEHRAYSDKPWINAIMASMLDLLGGSSYLWRWKHVTLHHTYVNIAGHDTDIDVGPLGRLSPHQKRYAFHRYQHFYMWALYGFMALRWHLFGDFQDLVTGKMGGHPFPRPKGRDLALLIMGKVAFFGLAFGLPMMLHAWWIVLLFYVTITAVLGVKLSVVFQLAHCVEEAEFSQPEAGTGEVGKAWSDHQVGSTVNFARRNPVLAWLLGGLNFQIEHHLFPRISHVHYPALSRVVEQTCRDFGLPYGEHRTVWAGLASHFRWLRRMGAAPNVG
jgi:linoleoyl-CoA desaturase